jgi:hypothetical protein
MLRLPRGRRIATDLFELAKLPFKPALCCNGQGGKRVGWRNGVLAGAGGSNSNLRSLDFPLSIAAEGFLCAVLLFTVFPGIAIAVAVWRFWRRTNWTRTFSGAT